MKKKLKEERGITVKKKLRGKHVVKMITKLSRTTGVKNKKNGVNQLLIKKNFFFRCHFLTSYRYDLTIIFSESSFWTT